MATPAGKIPTYYGRPAIKPSLYGWIVALYIFVGGLAAGVQIMVTAAELLAIPGSGNVSFVGRAIALALAIFGGILLIIDLHTKSRFYNMLRIFRPTSPMSIGTYALIGFGFWSLVAFIAQAVGASLIGLVCGCFAAVTGWWMASYTASLLAATATPLWAAAPKLLAVRFAASALATGAAAACLISLGVSANPGLPRAFGNLGALALFIQLVASIGSAAIYRKVGVNDPLQGWPWGPLYIAGVQLAGILAPLVLYVLANFFHGAGTTFWLIASGLALCGGLLMRAVVLLAGNASARRPEDYFSFAQERG